MIRIPSFGGIRGKEHHGESPETYYAHTAGLKVVAPSSALDGYRLLRLAIEDPDPVVFLEPKAKYWAKEEGELTTDGPGIGEGRVVRDGDACVVFAYGAMVARCLEAAELLDGEGRLGPRGRPSLPRAAGRRPDRALGSGRPDAPSWSTRPRRRSAWAARSPPAIMEEAFDFLQAPVARVTGWDVPYPPAALEHRYLPSVDRIAAAVRRVISY